MRCSDLLTVYVSAEYVANDVLIEVFYMLLMLCRRLIDFSLKGACDRDE